MVGRNKKWNSGQDIRRYRSPQVYSGRNQDKEEIVFPKWIFKAMAYLVIVIGLLYFVFYSQIFTIKQVIVEGNSLTPTENITKDIPFGKNIFLIRIDEIKVKLLSDYPEIRNIEIYRGIPSAVKIVMLERESKMVWQSGEDHYLISDQGEVMKKISAEEGTGLPKVIDKRGIAVKTGGQLVSPNFVAFILNINNTFFDMVNIKPLDFEVDETTFDVTLRTEAGFYVKFNSLRSSKKQLENLKTVLVNKRPDIKEYVDIRIDGWAYYK